MATSYDIIYQKFINITKTDNINLPSDDAGKYILIKDSIDTINNRLRTNYTYDDTLEQVNEDLNNDVILLSARFIRLNFLINQKTYYVSMLKPFTKDMGLLHYNVDIKGLETDIELESNKIEEIIKNMTEDYE